MFSSPVISGVRPVKRHERRAHVRAPKSTLRRMGSILSRYSISAFCTRITTAQRDATTRPDQKPNQTPKALTLYWLPTLR